MAETVVVNLRAKRERQNRWVKMQRGQVELEAALERRVVRYVESLGGWAVKVGSRGWPDRLVLLSCGRHVWMEFKRRKFGSLTLAQRRLLPRLRKAGEPVYVVRTFAEAQQVLSSAASWRVVP